MKYLQFAFAFTFSYLFFFFRITYYNHEYMRFWTPARIAMSPGKTLKVILAQIKYEEK